MRGLFLFGGLLFAVVISLIAATPPSAEESFADVVEKFVVYRNGEVVLDVRISDAARWKRELLERTAPWRMAQVSPGVFRYMVIHEYNRYHSVQLDKDQKVLSVHTTHVEERPLPASGPNWAKHAEDSK